MTLNVFTHWKLFIFINCILLCSILLLIYGYSDQYIIRILHMKTTDIKDLIKSNHSNNIIDVKYTYGNHGERVIDQTIWTNWIKDNRLSTVLNSNDNFSEKDIQKLYTASRHHTAHALNQNLSVEILKILGILVQEKIERNQNPEECSNRKKLVIALPSRGHGYGSQMNFIAMALHEALYAERTLILLNNKTWRYSPEGWEKVHSPLSKTCTTIDPKDSSGNFLNETHSGKQIMYLLDLKTLLLRSKVPAGIPRDIVPLLVAVHSRPTLWWHAQFIKYVSRLQPRVKDRVDNMRKELVNQGLVAPYVGVHVRRGDKIISSAQAYTLKAYMESVTKYFQTLAVKTAINQEVKSDITVVGSYNSMNQSKVNYEHKGKIYLATDDDQIFAKMKTKYPEYQIFVYTSHHHKRYGEDNLIEIIMDLTFLSEADFNVCTMSSNICRRTLDFKEVAHHVDMTSSIHSLDMQYMFRVIPEFRIATDDYIRDNTTVMVKGDVIKRIKWNWRKDRKQDIGNGYNERTEKQGVYPISKTKYYIKVADFPIYQNKNRSRAEIIVQMLIQELSEK